MTAASNATGLSVDGLWDSIYQTQDNWSTDPYLADVVMAQSSASILSLENAKTNRIFSGMPWPPHAQAELDGAQLPPRLPVAWAWRLLLESKGAFFWRKGAGQRARVEDAIAAHIAARLRTCGGTQVALAIPNDLNEYGQEWLLRALKRAVTSMRSDSIRLIWRPVAAALSLIESETFDVHSIDESRDYVLVVHFGPDALEIVTLALRRRVDATGSYVVPLRDGHNELSPHCGCDLAGQFVSRMLNQRTDFAGWWQGFTDFQETWKGLCELEWNEKKVERPWWCQNAGWRIWKVSPKDFDEVLEYPVIRPSPLCRLQGKPVRETVNWGNYITDCIGQAVEARGAAGRLAGLIVSGPLLPKRLHSLAVGMVERLPVSRVHVAVRSGVHVLVRNRDFDPISRGAWLYLDRLRQERIGFLDMVEQINVWAHGPERMQWHRLLQDLEVEGGRKSTATLSPAQFSLDANTKELTLFICKGDPSTGALRKSTVIFPFAAPSTNVRLQCWVQSASASGFAQVEFVPVDDKSFLAGERVYFDFERMDEASEDELPQPGRGYQEELLEIPVMDLASEWLQSAGVMAQWRAATPIGRDYPSMLNRARSVIRGSTVRGRAVDQYGKALNEESQKRVIALATTLGAHFTLVKNSRNDRKRMNSLLTTARWLYAAAPPEVTDYLRSRLLSGLASAHEVVASGYVLESPEDLKTSFALAAAQLPQGKNVPAWITALFHMLNLRGDAAELLNDEQANIFVQAVSDRVEEETRQHNFKTKFSLAIGCLQGLLRFRCKRRNFPGEVLSRTLSLQLEEAARLLDDYPSAQERIRRSLREALPKVLDYLQYRGHGNVLRLLEEAMEGESEDE